MMCKIKSCAGLHLFKAAILCSRRNYLNDIDPPLARGLEVARGGGQGWVPGPWGGGTQGLRQPVAAEGRPWEAEFTGSQSD